MSKKPFPHPTSGWVPAARPFRPVLYPAAHQSPDFPELNQQGARAAPIFTGTEE